MRESYITYFPEREPRMSAVAEELDEFSDENTADIPMQDEWIDNE